MDSSSSSPISGEMLMTCSRPLVIERRVLVRPQHDEQALKCPRCDSTHTKFCYYNNYSLTQPRYFCKTCRRYWTKGGTLRNIPVGGGCRKTKKVAKKSTHDPPPHHHPSSLPQHHPPSSPHHPSPGTDHLLHLPFPHHDPQHLNSILLGAQGSTLASGGFMDGIGVLESHHRPMDLIMESKLEAIVGSCYRSYDFMGNGGELGFVNGLGDLSNDHGLGAPNFHGISSLHGNSGTFIETCQRLTLNCENDDQNNEVDVKPNTKLLSLDYWQDHGKDSFGYISNNLGSSWSAMINGCGPSTTNPLV